MEIDFMQHFGDARIELKKFMELIPPTERDYEQAFWYVLGRLRELEHSISKNNEVV